MDPPPHSLPFEYRLSVDPGYASYTRADQLPGFDRFWSLLGTYTFHTG